MREPRCSTEENFSISQVVSGLPECNIFNFHRSKQSWRDLFLVVWVLSCSSVPHMFENTDQLDASEILFKEGCHVLDLAVALAALVDAVVLDPCLSGLVS